MATDREERPTVASNADGIVEGKDVGRIKAGERGMSDLEGDGWAEQQRNDDSLMDEKMGK